MIPPPPRSTLFPYTTLFRSKPEPFFEAVEDLRAGPPIVLLSARGRPFSHRDAVRFARSEEHTSELQSHSDLVCRLLLEKKKTSSRKLEIGSLSTGIICIAVT